MQRTAFIEPRCHGLEHVPFNAALISAVLTALPDAALDVYAEVTHNAAMEELLMATHRPLTGRVQYHSLEIPERRSRGWSRTRMTWRMFAMLDERLPAADTDAIVVATLDPAVIALLKLRLTGRWKQCRAVGVFHELLAALDRRSSRRCGLIAALAMPHPRTLTYVVLGDHIHSRLQCLAPRLSRYVVSIEHPSVFRELTPSADSVSSPPTLRIGFVGGGREAKGFDEFLDVVRAITVRRPDMQFEMVGSAPPAIGDSLTRYLTWSDEKLPLHEFAAKLSGLSHVVWLGDPHHYTLVASGSLADTLSLGIPVICKSGPYIDHLFRRFGDIGVRCTTREDVERAILRIASEFPSDAYFAQREAARAAGAALLPTHAAATLRSVLGDGAAAAVSQQ